MKMVMHWVCFQNMQKVVFEAPSTVENLIEPRVENSIQALPPKLHPVRDIQACGALVT